MDMRRYSGPIIVTTEQGRTTMRRFWILLSVVVVSLSLVLAGCAKEVIKETPEEGEEQPEGTGPKPPPLPVQGN